MTGPNTCSQSSQPIGRNRLPTPSIDLARMAADAPLSSRGLGRRILSPETGVRIPVAVLHESPANTVFSQWLSPRLRPDLLGSKSVFLLWASTASTLRLTLATSPAPTPTKAQRTLGLGEHAARARQLNRGIGISR